MDEYGDEAVQSLHFFYDAQSRPAFVEYNGVKYRYLHNLQGDIVGIVDGNGNLVVEYKYDAWGKLISITGSMADTLGKYNPFRYRGYVYDEEMGLYYLRSRYYSSKWQRFLCCDKLLGKKTITAHNVFAYCCNNPVIYSDPHGLFLISQHKDFVEKLESGMTFIMKKTLNYLDKCYSIEQPKTGVVMRPKPKTIAKGSSRMYRADRDQVFKNIGTVVFDEYYKFCDNMHMVYKLAVNIIQYDEGEPVADITLYSGRREWQSFSETGDLKDVFYKSYSVIDYTGSSYVLFSGGNYYETSELGTAVIDELLADIIIAE